MLKKKKKEGEDWQKTWKMAAEKFCADGWKKGKGNTWKTMRVKETGKQKQTNDNNTKESHRGNMEKKMDSVRNIVQRMLHQKVARSMNAQRK